tara:strand:+ start:420 stop:809 length:390 start_codon:yes stop_codon:yes gene_type:complete
VIEAMLKITIPIDCGNSPKMEFLKQFNIAFAESNTSFLLESVVDDITWNILGDRLINGKTEFSAELDRMKSEAPTELIIEKIITHGKLGAVNGIMKMPNEKSYAFSDIYEFSTAKGSKIATITSYVIAV